MDIRKIRPGHDRFIHAARVAARIVPATRAEDGDGLVDRNLLGIDAGNRRIVDCRERLVDGADIVVAQVGEGLLVQVAGNEPGAVQEHLGLADAAEQGRVLGMNGDGCLGAVMQLLGLGLFTLLGRDEPVLQHPINDVLLADGGTFGVADGVVGRWRLGKARDSALKQLSDPQAAIRHAAIAIAVARAGLFCKKKFTSEPSVAASSSSFAVLIQLHIRRSLTISTGASPHAPMHSPSFSVIVPSAVVSLNPMPSFCFK